MSCRNFLFAEGDKVFLTKFTFSDITPEYIGWLNDEEVVRYSNQRFKIHNEQTCNSYLRSFLDTDNLLISIVSKEDGLRVGTLTVYPNHHHDFADMGIMIGNKAVWGKGFGFDAWRTMGNWLLNSLEVRKLTAGAARQNAPMVRIMEQFGMHHEATLHKQEWHNEAWCDMVYYAKFKDT